MSKAKLPYDEQMMKIKRAVEQKRYWNKKCDELEVQLASVNRLYIDKKECERQNTSLKESVVSAEVSYCALERQYQELEQSSERELKDRFETIDRLQRETIQRFKDNRFLGHENEKITILHSESLDVIELLKRSVNIWKVGFFVCLCFLYMSVTAWAYFAK